MLLVFLSLTVTAPLSLYQLSVILFFNTVSLYPALPYVQTHDMPCCCRFVFTHLHCVVILSSNRGHIRLWDSWLEVKRGFSTFLAFHCGTRRQIWLLAIQTFIFPPQKKKLFIIWQGHIACKSFFYLIFFFTNFKIIFISSCTCTRKVFLFLCLGCYRCFFAGFYEAVSFDFRVVFHFFPDIITLHLSRHTPPHHHHHLATVYHFFGLLSVPSIFSLPLIPPPRSHPSVRRENRPHKIWKGLFKRNSSVMKTHYCIPWCSACGGRCWPATILFS